MSLDKSKLRHELITAGASKEELISLVHIADNLKVLSNKTAETKSKQSLLSLLYKKKIYTFSLAALTGLIMIAAILSASQNSLPGSRLYLVKKLSENTLIKINPAYRSTAMMHRAVEIKQLVYNRSSSVLIYSALNDYNVESAAYKMPSYTTIEFCKKNLQQAAIKATPNESSAIQKTISSLSS